jgi:integrase
MSQLMPDVTLRHFRRRVARKVHQVEHIHFLFRAFRKTCGPPLVRRTSDTENPHAPACGDIEELLPDHGTVCVGRSLAVVSEKQVRRDAVTEKVGPSLVDVLGKKVWATWELDLGKPQKPQQPYFTDEQLQQIINTAEGQNRVLFALLAGTGMRIGEAAGLHVEDLDLNNCVITVRRAVWNGVEQSPKTENAVREIDIDPALAGVLRLHVMGKTGRVFESQTGTPISGNNILKRVLHPLLAKLGMQKAGLHAFRHSRVTMLRKNGTPADLQLQWIGHSSLRTTDRYSHTNQELEYRRLAASKAGLNIVVGPNGPN